MVQSGADKCWLSDHGSDSLDISGVHLLRVLETSNPRCTEGSLQLKLQLT